MPESEAIVQSLTSIANEAWPFALAWHALIGVAIAALLLGFRPTCRTAAGLALTPLASVAVFAGAHSDPFNAVVFAASTVVLFAIACRLAPRPVRRGPRLLVAVGVALVAFAWVYPHFLEGRSSLAYLYAAPVGLVPCPTLALVIGATLVAGGFSSGWSTLLAALGLFYGLFGAFRLGVMLDVVLTAGSVVLLATAWRPVSTGLHPFGTNRRNGSPVPGNDP